MSVVNVKEDYSVREAMLASDTYTARRRFTVLCNSIEDGPIVARQGTGVPRLGDAHPTASQLLVTSLPTRPVGNSHHLFEVMVEYSVPTTSFGSIEGSPIDQPAIIRWGSASTTEPIDEDGDGKPIVNSAKESFDPGLTDDFDDPVLTITRNEAVFSPATKLLYEGACNSDTFYGAAPGEAKMLPINADRVIVGTTVAYWTVTYSIQFRLYHPNQTAERAWWKRVLNQGYREYRPSQTDPYTPRLDISSPILLDGGGGQGVFGESLKLAVGAEPVWFEFKPKRWRLVAFAPLGLQ